MAPRKIQRMAPKCWSHPPAVIDVLGREYRVEVVTPKCLELLQGAEGAMGRTESIPGVIYLNGAMNAGLARSTLLHEILHVVIFCGPAEAILHMRKRGDDIEELMVLAMEPILLSVLTDNPYLTSWLTTRTSL